MRRSRRGASDRRPFRAAAPLVQDHMNAGKPPLEVLVNVSRDVTCRLSSDQ